MNGQATSPACGPHLDGRADPGQGANGASEAAEASGAGAKEEDVITDLVQIQRLAQEKEGENLAFRRYLHDHHRPEHEFEEIAARVEGEIDCTKCANCCREMDVEVSTAEVTAIAAQLGMRLDDAMRLYTSFDPHSEERTLAQKDGVCVFLDGMLCMVYEARPRTCREFPHTHPHGVSLGSRMSSVCLHASVCPILFNALEEYKHRLGFHQR